MPAFRVLWRARARAGSLMVAMITTLALSACDGVPGLGGDATPESQPPSSGSLGPCLPWIGTSVVAGAMDGAGNRVIFISGERPPTLGDDASWDRGEDRALMVADRGEGGGYLERHIALSWEAQDAIPEYATAEPDRPTPEGVALPEQMADVQIDRTGSRFVVAVTREGVTGNYAKLYTGSVPPTGSQSLAPNNGLELVPINNYLEGEGVQSFELSPDGSKLAATVGVESEVRVWDFNAQGDNLFVYEEGAKGAPVVSHDLPQPATNVDAYRTPLVTSPGAIRLNWSPDSMRLAISRQGTQVAQAELDILDAVNGKLAQVRSFANSTVPHAVWASDGASLFVMTTPLVSGASGGDTAFSDSQIARIEASKEGDNIGDGAEIHRVLGVVTEPTNLVGFGDDERFVFTWDGRLFRFNAPGGNLAQATFVPISGDPNTSGSLVLSSSAFPPHASADADLVMFLVQDDSSRHVGFRNNASADKCPEIPTPEGGGETTEGESGAAGEATTAPTEAESAPTEAESVPTEAESVPTEAESAPTEAEPGAAADATPTTE